MGWTDDDGRRMRREGRGMDTLTHILAGFGLAGAAGRAGGTGTPGGVGNRRVGLVEDVVGAVVASLALIGGVVAIGVFGLVLLGLWRGVGFFRRRGAARPSS